MNRIIVTGANGFLGKELIRRLLDDGYEVLAIDISFSGFDLEKNPRLHIYTVDLSDAYELKRVVSNSVYDTVYHFAWRGVNGSEKSDPQVQLDNIRMLINCVNAAKAAGCRRFLCAGTVAEQAIHSLSRLTKTSGGMMYGSAKCCAHIILETYCKNIDLEFVWMQFSNIYGPNNRTGNLISYTLGEILEDRIATFGPALQPYDFIYIDDLITAVYKIGLAEKVGNYYFIGSGTPRRLLDYLKTIGALCGKQELIQIGARPDDGVSYSEEMFDICPLVNVIGDYVSVSFEDGIKKTMYAWGKRGVIIND